MCFCPDEPWKGPLAICGLIWVRVSLSECVSVSSVHRGRSAAAPLSSLSCQSGTIWRDGWRWGVSTSVTCLYLAAARAQHCSCFPKSTGRSMIMRRDVLIRTVATWVRRGGGGGGAAPSHLLLGVWLVKVSPHFLRGEIKICIDGKTLLAKMFQETTN